MNRSQWLTDDLIEAAFERRAGRTNPADLGQLIVTRIAGSSQQGAWRARVGLPSTALVRPAWIALVVLGLLLGVLIALALAAGHSRPARPGLLAYVQAGDVYLANSDGTGAIRAAHDDGVVFSAPKWSSSGRLLEVEGSGAVFVLDPGTLELRRITVGHDGSWSADGQSLAFIATPAVGPDVIDVVRIDTGAVRELRPQLAGGGGSIGGTLVWSPDGRWILASASIPNSAVFVRVDATSGETVPIGPMPHLNVPEAAWSGDSGRIAYAGFDPCPEPGCPGRIVVTTADLSSSAAITGAAVDSRGPVWSPDGQWIALTTRPVASPGATFSDPVFAANATISVIRPDGRDLRIVARTAARGLSWNADGTAIEFVGLDAPGSATGLDEVRLSDGLLTKLNLPMTVDDYALQSVAADHSASVLPSAPSASPAGPSFEAPGSPPAAPPADPSGSWSGLAVDGYCSAGILNFQTQVSRLVGPACPDSGTAVFAPEASSYAIPAEDGSVTVVRRDGSKTIVLKAMAALGQADMANVDVAWSPEGAWLFVHRCRIQPSADCVDPEYLVLGADGRGTQRLPAQPAWSADGHLLVVKALDGNLLIGSPDGSGLHAIGNLPIPASWAPDSGQFAFVRDGNAWIANADGSAQRNLTNFANGGVYDASWSPDGRSIAVIQESRLSILSVGDGTLRPIDLGPGRIGFYSVAWSPDAAHLEVTILAGDTPTRLIVQTRDWSASTLDTGQADQVKWSPDGRFIALLSSENDRPIAVANADGSGLRVIGSAPGALGGLTWVP